MARVRQRALVAGATLGAAAVFAADAQAATYVVNSTADDGTGTCNPGACTLRDAVTTANANGTPGTVDTVDLTGVSGTITLDAANGAIGIDDPGGLTISGPGAGTLTVSGGGATGIFQINPGPAAVSISGLTLIAGASQNGGAIDNTGAPLTISDSTITGNTADTGGGIAAFGKYASVTIENSTISGNTAGAGGGISSATKYGTTIVGSTISNNTATAGGGLAVVGISPSERQNPVLVQDSTISGNQAPSGAGINIGGDNGSTPVTVKTSTISGNEGGPDSFGGGVLITGTRNSPFQLVDSTISGNSANEGGGVSLGYADSGYALLGEGGSIAFDNATIAQNTSGASSGGGIFLGQYDYLGSGINQSATASINSTIVAGNTAGGAPNDLFRPTTSTSGGFNDTFSLIEAPGNAPLLSSQALITGVDPQLGPLTDNSGPTETMLPSNTSPVIDQGNAQGLTTDQRGQPRTVDNGKAAPPGGDGTDIGAVELALIPPTPPEPTPTPPPPVVTPPAVTPPVPKPPVVVTTKCKSRRHFVIRIKERRGRFIRTAKVFVHGHRVAVVRRRSDHRLVAVVDLRGLPKGTYRVVIKARFRNGHRGRWVRSYRTCVGPLPSSNHLDDPRAL